MVAAAALGLGVMGDPRALPLLRQRWATELYEVHEAVSRVIGNLERKQIGEHDWLQVDTADPYGQLKRIWSQFDVIRGDDLLRARAIQWHSQFVQAMPSSKFGSDEELLSNLVEIPFQANCRSVRRSRHPVDLAML